MAKRTTSPTTATNGNGTGSTVSATAATAASALQTLPDDETARVIAAGFQTMSPGARGELMDRLAPDQAMTNDIWRWIVRTFALVLAAATAALLAAVIASLWRKGDTAMIQIVLTVFTTTAGILAGFVSGRMSRAA
jgi:hypothetical protein